MNNLKHSLFDFPEDPTKTDWDKEALLFYYYMLSEEEKYEKRINDLIKEFKRIFNNLKETDVVKRKKIFNELKNELYRIKKKDHIFERSLVFILLITKVINKLEDTISHVISKKSQIESLQKLLPQSEIDFNQELKDIEELKEKSFTKAINELTRIIRTESWRYVNEARLEEFRKKGYKYKTTYPVKDNRTGDDSLFYYDEHQVKPLNEPFNYVWNGKERVFMTPPDRPNDRNILIPYIIP